MRHIKGVYKQRFTRKHNRVDHVFQGRYRINHSKLFADRHNHINGIENFWNQAKRHLRKFNGVPKEHFPLLKGM